jgi:hypothetical protein
MRSVALSLLTVAAMAPALSVVPAEARLAPSDWVPMSTSWPATQSVKVSDIASFGKFAYVVGTTSKGAKRTPWVQTCTKRRCNATLLPKPRGANTTVTSISGTDRTDMWAVGYTTVGARHRAVFWRKVGKEWSVVHTGLDDDIKISQVEVSNKSKAFATGRLHYGDLKGNTTSPLYRWNGTGWKEVSPVLEADPNFPQPCDGWYNRNWIDIIARSGSAVVIGTCGVRKRQVVLEQGDTDWTVMEGDGLPDDVTWDEGSLVGQQVWLTGMRNNRRVIVANDGDGWSRVTTEGIRANAVISDIAGVFASKVTAVGWIPTGGRHRVARAWRWGAGTWHETEVPAGVSRSMLLAASVDSTGPVFAAGNDMGRKPHLRALVIRSVG